jgi:tetratricopeptide (TPR) repeat protein
LIYYYQEKNEKAIEYAEKLCIQDANNIDNYHHLAIFKMKSLDYEGAINSYNKMLSIDSNNQQALTGKASLYS